MTRHVVGAGTDEDQNGASAEYHAPYTVLLEVGEEHETLSKVAPLSTEDLAYVKGSP